MAGAERWLILIHRFDIYCGEGTSFGKTVLRTIMFVKQETKMQQLSATPLSSGNWTITMTTASGPVGNNVVGPKFTLSDMLASIRTRHPTLDFASQDEAETALAAAQMSKLAGIK